MVPFMFLGGWMIPVAIAGIAIALVYGGDGDEQ